MANWLKRLRAQSRDPAARRQAVAHDPVEALGQPLAQFARTDDDAAVRKLALRRAADLALSQERMQEDSDASVCEVAQKLYRELLAGTHAEAPALAERLDMLGDIGDSTLLEHLACHAAEPELREAALRKLNHPGLVIRRLTDDPDRALRLRLLEEIDDPALLQRIVDKTRRRDRQLHRQAEARLRALKIAAGDAQAIQEEAEFLCRELEAMPGGNADTAAIEALDARWEAIRQAVDPVLGTRHDNARAQAMAAAHAPDNEAPKPDTAARTLPRMDEPAHASGRVEQVSPEVQKLAAEHRFRASVAASEPDSLPKSKVLKKKPAPAFESMLEALEAALEQGDLSTADECARKIMPRQAALPKKLAGRWHRAHNRVNEMKRWQQWSSRRQRRQLCVEARAMRGSDLHPEAIANRIRELRQTWKQLDALEPVGSSGHAADAALQRRFHALCQRALEPTRAWFEQRNAARSEHTQKIEALLAAESPTEDDWKALASRRRMLAAARRELDQVEPRARKALARKLTHAIKGIDAPLDTHYQDIRKAHERLISRAQALMELAPNERPAAARELQKEWQALGPGRRDLDRKQWRTFRTALDAVFAEREQQKKARDEQRQKQQREASRLLQELEAQSKKLDAADALQASLRQARQDWRTLDVRDRSLARRWDALRAEIEQRVRELEAETVRQRYRAWLDAAAKNETPDDMPTALRDAVTKRGKTTIDDTQIRELLVQMEALAGIDSPPDDHDLRMQIKLKRLQASLGDGKRENPRSELERHLAEWIALDMPSNTALHQRFEAAFSGILHRIR